MIVEGNETGLLLSGGVVSGYTEVPDSASNLQLSIEDENGVLLEQIPLGNRTSGSMSVRWDGLNMMVDGEIIDIDVNKLNRQEYYKDEDGELVLDANGDKIPVPYPAGEYVQVRRVRNADELAGRQRHHERQWNGHSESGGWPQCLAGSD